MKKKETFSLRKYKIGTVSVLLGAVFLPFVKFIKVFDEKYFVSRHP
ncbi:YSIRK-type signal peptide-containing protein, partial [Streptococcus suis]